MDITRLSRNIAEYFGESLGYTEEETDLLRFGFEIIIGEGTKLITLIGIAIIYGLLPEMLAAIITFTLFRFISGGAHSGSHNGCFVITTLTFTGVAFAGQISGTVLNKVQLMLLVGVVFAAAIISITLWAPAPNTNKPIKIEHKRRLKYFSYILLVLWLGSIAAIILSISPSLYPRVVGLSAFSLGFEAFTLSPLGFRFMEYADQIINGEEGIEDV